MELQLEETGKGGRFYYQKAGNDLAEIVFVWAGTDKMIIEHTEVDDSLKGQGVGNMLVARAADYAREKGAKILPLCPYAKHVMHKSPEYRDVLVDGSDHS